MIPSGRDRGAAKYVDEGKDTEYQDDVRDAEAADDPEARMGGEAEVETEHRELVQREGDTPDYACAVNVLQFVNWSGKRYKVVYWILPYYIWVAILA